MSQSVDDVHSGWGCSRTVTYSKYVVVGVRATRVRTLYVYSCATVHVCVPTVASVTPRPREHTCSMTAVLWVRVWRRAVSTTRVIQNTQSRDGVPRRVYSEDAPGTGRGTSSGRLKRPGPRPPVL